MKPSMLFLISSPRSGSTMLERILASHSMILGGPEPHLLTPLAHLGVWANVDKAPYDHILAAESQKLFIQRLPHGEADYWHACRAYCDTIYGGYLSTSTKSICLDKTPAYGLVLPFVQKVFPDAKYIVLTRHPIATFSSYAHSFFDGNYQTAYTYNPILNRYIPAMSAFLRQTDTLVFHVRYEDLVKEPEHWMEKIYAYIGVPFEKETIDYGNKAEREERPKGLGDPIGVQQHKRPSTSSVKKWVEDLATNPQHLAVMREMLEHIAPEDLKTIGYSPENIWKPLEETLGKTITPRKTRLTRYRLQRKLIVNLRGAVQSVHLLRKVLSTLRLACDVLLRE